MNPLDMTGPEFLRFYLVYGLCGLALAGLLRLLWNHGVAANAELRWEPGYYPQGDEAYGIALLRGGRTEAARALLSKLLAEDFIAVKHGEVRKTEKAKDLFGLDSLERLSVQSLAPRQTPAGAEIVIESQTALAGLQEDLERQGLVPPQDARNRLLGLCGLALLMVPGLGVLKLTVALGRGKMNIGFLLILLAVYTAATLVLLLPPRRTAAGRRYLTWLQSSHQSLRDRLESGRREQPAEIALAAGIYGTTLLVVPPSPPQRKKEEGGGGCGSCGGGSSSGGDGGGGGGSCGGGGCGGGGCGGCGS